MSQFIDHCLFQICRKRNELGADYYDFLVQGESDISLVHLPRFHLANHRQQIIVSAKLSSEGLRVYQETRKANPKEKYVVQTYEAVDLRKILEAKGTFKARLQDSKKCASPYYHFPMRST